MIFHCHIASGGGQTAKYIVRLRSGRCVEVYERLDSLRPRRSHAGSTV